MSISLAVKCSSCGHISKYVEVPDKLSSNHAQAFKCDKCGMQWVMLECPSCQHHLTVKREDKKAFILTCPECRHVYTGILE